MPFVSQSIQISVYFCIHEDFYVCPNINRNMATYYIIIYLYLTKILKSTFIILTNPNFCVKIAQTVLYIFS